MKRRGVERRRFGDPLDRATSRASDFGIEADYSCRISTPSANDIHAKVTIPLPYIRWLGRAKVPPHENN